MRRVRSSLKRDFPVSYPIIAGLALCAALSSSVAWAQKSGCLSQDRVIARQRAAEPSTVIVGRYAGDDAAALFAAMSTLSAAFAEEPDADEVTVLAATSGDYVQLIGTQHRCLIWLGILTVADYEGALGKAFGPQRRDSAGTALTRK